MNSSINKDKNILQVALPILHLPLLNYLGDPDQEIGDLVLVPLRNKQLVGIVYGIGYNAHKKVDATKLKPIIASIKLANKKCTVSSTYLQFLVKASVYYLYPLGCIMTLALPLDLTKKRKKDLATLLPMPELSKKQPNICLPALSEPQQLALQRIIHNWQTSPLKPCLLHGITSSGKTEIYFHLIKHYQEKGQQALIMLPEIALSNQIVERFTVRFGFKPAVWHSNIPSRLKQQILQGIITGDVKVIIGARSSLFLPYHDLGLIIVDEEHDSSYKQEEGVIYNARDMAVLRSYYGQIPVVLASATPALESFHNTQVGKYHYIKLDSRYNQAAIPQVTILDMAQHKYRNGWLSLQLQQHMAQALDAKEQILLFLNRKGYSPLTLCRFCSFRLACPNCSAWLVWHKNSHKLICHHCSYSIKDTTCCPNCTKEEALVPCGPGIERLMEEVSHLFPSSRITFLSKDQANNQTGQAIFQQIIDHQVDIVIGTQVITKGHHFPKLSLVGVIDADLGFAGRDIRALENTFQLLYQVGGRAGRSAGSEGKVYIQTSFPDNYALQMLKAGKQEEFMNYELSLRKEYNLPPFTKCANIMVSSADQAQVLTIAQKLVSVAPQTTCVSILGPVPAAIFKLRNQYRLRLSVLSSRQYNLQAYLCSWLALMKAPATVRIKVDIDPYNFA